mmetsp:Transcript_17868/g.54682  ORF Transcript_17868/g.54682 Transcript_17868/m.54682 type:complete len:274 (-) Transcript_17868:489-1310(-)
MFLLEEGAVRVQLEHQQQDVHKHEAGRRHAADEERDFDVVGGVGAERGHDHGHAAEQQQRHVGDRRRGVEAQGRVLEGALLILYEATREEARAQHQQQVGQHGPQHGRLHDADLVGTERLDGHHHLDGVAEGGVDEPADGLARVQRELLGEVAEHGRQRHHGEEVEPENPVGTPVEVVRRPAKGQEDQEHVERLRNGEVEQRLEILLRRAHVRISLVLLVGVVDSRAHGGPVPTPFFGQKLLRLDIGHLDHSLQGVAAGPVAARTPPVGVVFQ